jgi:hypothetical protein
VSPNVFTDEISAVLLHHVLGLDSPERQHIFEEPEWVEDDPDSEPEDPVRL